MKAFSHGGTSGLTSTVIHSNITKISTLLVGSRWMNHRHQLRHMGMPCNTGTSTSSSTTRTSSSSLFIILPLSVNSSLKDLSHLFISSIVSA
mmetsp:Transcript_10316/g.8611  ORF Transcript_10316/g.8611 Transcript_10316/m.8611 type:complete len:92 (-) Transcript_10316:109-384(-)